MSKNSLLLVDPNFKAELSVNCHLLLKITNDSFSYAVLSNDNEEINVIFDKQGCADVEQALKTAFETDAYLALNYSSIKVAVHTSSFVFIPDEWFDADKLAVYSKYLDTEGKIYTKHNSALGFNTIFSLGEQIQQQLPEHANVYPQSAPLLALSNHLENDSLLIDFTSVSFNVLYLKDNKVQFQNHYPSETAEEFNYFLLLIIEQLELTENIPVYLQGIINEDDDYYNCLLKYFNQLYFFLPTQKQNSELLADMPKHYFSSLLALDLCE
ncbi:DUF3822 domain-containing protein [Pedobacter yonginense]|uniref:DUF3822 domain-containing protein n=1 Tax=Pedobacter yonginense TaxID=651869 RepID=A0A317ETZ8_9SPHI|nr:DUF3822 family protein [Pedobacter yonginense]PWS29507.1 DUF3822 domain-containing protein [Pedobacter yonginense]